jgi:hypothetical protein
MWRFGVLLHTVCSFNSTAVFSNQNGQDKFIQGCLGCLLSKFQNHTLLNLGRTGKFEENY